MVETEAKSRILSPALIGFFRRRLMEACGLFLMIAGLALTATLFSPGRYDPSFSAFSSGDIENWFGALGASIAGAFRASLGSASFFLTLLPIGWGYRLVRKQTIGFQLTRLFLSPVSLLLIAAGLYGLAGAGGNAAGGAAGVEEVGALPAGGVDVAGGGATGGATGGAAAGAACVWLSSSLLVSGGAKGL